MRTPSILLFSAILIPTSALAQNIVVLVEEDFESGGGALDNGNPGARVTQVPDPAVGGTNGTVAAVDIGGAGQWGEIRAVPQNIPLAGGSVPGTDTFNATVAVYIDSANTTFIPGELQDRFNLILRFNDGVDDADRANQANNNSWETLTPDQWNTVAVSGTIPATDMAGDTISHVLPIISFRDENDNAVTGTAAYFDNFRIEATLPADDPNLSIIPLVNFGEVEQGTGPVSQTVGIHNTGTSVALEITAGDIVGANPGQFALVGASFPVTINPGESLPLEIAFDPGLAVADFTARLDLASNDENDAVVSVDLSGSGIPVFNGSELIINGDFETGDLSDWRDDARLDFAATPAHSGSGAAAFNLVGGNQWGEARINGPSPPTPADDAEAIAITPEMIGKRYRCSVWYYRPTTGGMAPNDIVSTIFRWNKSNVMNHNHGLTIVGDIPVDTWVQATGEGVIPATGGDGLPTTSVVPIWSFQDVGSDATGGEVMYFDDVSFQVEATPASPEPIMVGVEIDEANSRILVRWKAVPGATYAVDRSTALKPDTVFPGGWAEVRDGITANAIDFVYPDPAGFALGEDALFYRVRLLSLP